jgi:hypothetical protein
MIRRNILINEWDYRAVKWSLIASAFALSLGAFAQTKLEVHAQDPASVVETAELPPAPDAPLAPAPPATLRSVS